MPDSNRAEAVGPRKTRPGMVIPLALAVLGAYLVVPFALKTYSEERAVASLPKNLKSATRQIGSPPNLGGIPASRDLELKALTSKGLALLGAGKCT